MTTVPPTWSAVDALAVASTMSPSDRATPSADCASRGPGAFSSIAVNDVTLRCGPSREGRDCCPALSTLVDNPPRDGIECASISIFVDTWISPPPYVAPPPRDFTFKAVIGEPDW